ncbi:MAG: hypothetical protein V4617_19490 [Gemmatimonadota bacterium]
MVSAGDTARGVLLQIGSEPLTSLVLEPKGRAARLTLEGAMLDVLKAAEGLEIVVRGRLTDTRAPAAPAGSRVFQVASFTVRAAEGRAAHDGVVVRDTEGFALRLQDGTLTRAPHMPVALQSKPGARVFLVGPLMQSPAAYGILAEPR